MISPRPVRASGRRAELDDVDSTDIDLAGRLAELLDRLAEILNRMASELPHCTTTYVAYHGTFGGGSRSVYGGRSWGWSRRLRVPRPDRASAPSENASRPRGCTNTEDPAPSPKAGIATGYTRADTDAVAKVMVSLPDELLGQLDAAAKRRGTTRSGLLAAMVRRELAHPTPAAVRDAVALLEDCFSATSAFEAADVIRVERDERDQRDRERVQPC